MLILIAIFALLFLGLALWRLDRAILLTLAALPAYLIRFKILFLPSTFLEVMILIAFAVWFFKFFAPSLKTFFQDKTKRLNYPFKWEIILLIIIAFIAAGVSHFSSNALGIWKAYFFEPILVFILIFNVFKEKKDWAKILWALLISAAIVSLFAIFQEATGLFISNPLWQALATRRAVSFFGYPNAVGLYLAPLVLVFLGWLTYLPWKNWREKIITKIIIALTIILSLLAIYFARSTGALVGIAVALLVFALFANRRLRLWGGSALIVVIALLFLIAPSRHFIINKVSFQDLSGQIRKQQWKETLIMLNDGHFWLGAGLDNYQSVIAPYHKPGLFFNRDHLANFDAQLTAIATLRAKYWQPVEIYMYPHDIFLNFWSELGLAGLLLFVWLIVKFLIIAVKLTLSFGREKRAEKYLALGLLSAMVAIIIHGLVDVPYFKNDLAVMFWLLLAGLGYLQLIKRLEDKQ